MKSSFEKIRLERMGIEIYIFQNDVKNVEQSCSESEVCSEEFPDGWELADDILISYTSNVFVVTSDDFDEDREII